jgi:hypothetical protein
MSDDVKAMATSIDTATKNYIKQPRFPTTYVPPFHYSK